MPKYGPKLRRLLDDLSLLFGSDGDGVIRLRSTVLNADTALADVLIGTVEAQALAANSLMISNVTASGDIAMYVNKGGHSQMAVWLDGSSGDTAVMAASGASVDHYIAGTKVLDHASGAFAFQESTVVSSTGTLTINAATLGGTLTVPDDTAIALGTGGTVSLIYETADPNANALVLAFAEGGGTDVPVFAIGDASILNADLGWWNGITEPTIAVVNDAADAYVSLDAGDDAVAGSKGLYFKAAADEDIELLNISVTGTPRVFWDESEDAIAVGNHFAVGGSLKLAGDIDLSASGTGTYDVILKDAVADALSILRGATDMMVFDTGTPQITITPQFWTTGVLYAAGGIVLPFGGRFDMGNDIGELAGSAVSLENNSGVSSVAQEVFILDSSKTRSVTGSAGTGNESHPLVIALAGSAGSATFVWVSGIADVNCDTAAVAIGDILVTSSATAKKAMTNNAQTDPSKIIGIALDAKAGGAAGTVRTLIKGY